MIELSAPGSMAAAQARAVGPLVARFGDDPAGLPVTESAAAWVECLTSRLPATAACAVLEHLFGVLPIAAACFAPPGVPSAVAAGERLAALGLFTPAPEPGWESAAVAGETAAGGWRLCGEVRIASPAADGAIVLMRLAGEQRRLAWLDVRAAGVKLQGGRRGGTVRGQAPCWLALEGAVVADERVSPPVSLAPGSELCRLLEDYAGVWALAATLAARAGVRALRRAARATCHQGKTFAASQLVAMEIAALEIEADLAATAVAKHCAPAPQAPARAAGLALATAAARILSAVAAKTAELRDLAGLELAGEPAEGLAPALIALLGGPLLLESELARALGIGEARTAEEGA